VGIDTIIAIVSGTVGAFAGFSRALTNFNQKISSKFETIERDLDRLEDRVLRDYVLKEDFLREIHAVHGKLDRILDYLLSLNKL
jgi:Mg2+ and Co2+ transporter CorA